ncbi:DegT/DnrJ/EryC1/StrS family aminotransferase [Flavobacteriaceae bacterium F08102]|nr:DegT/DnrJ/EryC1/StrS family aminotransferase [Flavobacteriaceae bacterium F08102]
MKFENPIYVTQPSLPDLDLYKPYLEKIWKSKILTNNGPFHRELEEALAKELGVKYVSLFTNGTLALLTALQTLRITGEVITTPYTFVATANSLIWNNLTPVFVDIDPKTNNLDAEKIEAAITAKTTAIMPVHVYGNPCDVDKIQDIADTYSLKVIYDAAHAFGVNYKGQSLLNYGDLSILSFHATKVFNTMEGGAIISHDEKTKKRIDYLKNFGFKDEVTVIAAGINSKMNEMQSALGLLQLKHYKKYIEKRKLLAALYVKQLSKIEGINTLAIVEGVEDYNYSYFPIYVEASYGKSRDELYEFLKQHNVFGRRYFYPLISDFPLYSSFDSANRNNLKVASTITEKVICLPIYAELTPEEVIAICKIIENGQ